MAYKSTIPAPTDKLRDSQNDLLNNFAAIKAAFDINHYTFDLADQGKHTHISFPEQAADPGAVVTECQLYAKQSALSTAPELFVQRGDGTVYEFSSATRNATGWTRLPSGILLKWGNTSGTGANTVTFPVAATVPAFTAIYSVQLTPFAAGATDSDIAVRLVALTTTTFDVYCTARSTSADKLAGFHYLAIGI